MLALSLLALLAAEPPPGPAPLEKLVTVAAADLLTRVKPEDRPVTRYLSLHATDEPERSDFLKAQALAVNGAQFGGDLVKLRVIAGGRLVRLNLRDLRWDAFSREVELEKLARLGVRFVAEGRALNPHFVDIWEGIARKEPFFDLHRGTLPPQLVADVVRESHSAKFIMAAHWLYPRLLLEPQDGGDYSFLLLNPPTKADLEKRWGVFRKFIDVDPRAKHGAALVKSASVAYNPREIQLLQSNTGFDAFHHWVTSDFLKADRKDKDPRESPAGTSRPDGQETIFSLPNGLLAGYLNDARGNQVSVVPQAIAEDQRPSREGVYHSPTKSVVNPFKCHDCHGESRGILGFGDEVLELIAPPRLDTAYLVEAGRAKDAVLEAQRIEDFYRKGLVQKAEQHRVSYEARVKECTGLPVFESTRLLVRYYDRYTPAYASEPVTPEQAAREMVYPLPLARVLWKLARDRRDPGLPNSQLGFLAAGRSITRRQWDANVPAAFDAAAVPITRAK